MPENARFTKSKPANNNWSLREMTGQIDSELYTRLALITDKQGLKKLSENGQFIEKPVDAVKDPYVLEFLGLPPRYQTVLPSKNELNPINKTRKYLPIKSWKN